MHANVLAFVIDFLTVKKNIGININSFYLISWQEIYMCDTIPIHQTREALIDIIVEVS